MRRHSISAKGAAGFSIIELLTVVAIVMIMAAVALPKIGRYFRNYQMSSAVREVSGEIQAARNKAVMKNVNFGSVFYVRSATTYRVALEDDQNLADGREPRALRLSEAENTAAWPGQLGLLRSLPGDVTFVGAGTNACAGGTFTANDTGLRFNRLGQVCNPGILAGECRLALEPLGAPNLVMNDTNGAAVCLFQPSTGLKRLIRISPGGRVMSREGQG